MARVTISGDTKKVTDAILGGTPSIPLKSWFDFAKGHTTVISRTVHGISSVELDHENMSMTPILLALSEGFKVEGAPIYIKMSPARYAGQVPQGISNRSYFDETGTNIVRKWSEWKDAAHEHMTASDGDKIVPGNSFGEELPSDSLLALMLGGYTMFLGSEVNVNFQQEL